MNRLSQHFIENEPQQTLLSLEQIDLFIEALEHLIDDPEGDEQIAVSQEGLMSDFFKNKSDWFADQLEDLFKGAGGVQESISKRLDALARSARELDRDKTIKAKYTAIAPFFFDVEKKRYRFDLERALSDDGKWVSKALALLDGLDDGVETNLTLLDQAPLAKGPRAFESYWSDRANAKCVSAGHVFEQHALKEHTLFNTRFEMAKGYDADKRGNEYTKQGTPVVLLNEKPSVDRAAKRVLEQPFELTQKDISGYLRHCEQLSQFSQTLHTTIKEWQKKYHPIKGPVFQSMVSIENEGIKQMGLPAYASGISILGQANRSLLLSITKAPLRLLTRNLKLLRVMIRFSDQFF